MILSHHRMGTSKLVAWVLRIAVAGEFLGHGVLAIQGKAAWVTWIQQILSVGPDTAASLLPFIGWMDVAVAVLVLVYPFRLMLLWAALWGFWTALVRPIVGEPIWDLIERWANWGAPLALLLVLGWPKVGREWWK